MEAVPRDRGGGSHLLVHLGCVCLAGGLDQRHGGHATVLGHAHQLDSCCSGHLPKTTTKQKNIDITGVTTHGGITTREQVSERGIQTRCGWHQRPGRKFLIVINISWITVCNIKRSIDNRDIIELCQKIKIRWASESGCCTPPLICENRLLPSAASCRNLWNSSCDSDAAFLFSSLSIVPIYLSYFEDTAFF